MCMFLKTFSEMNNYLLEGLQTILLLALGKGNFAVSIKKIQKHCSCFEFLFKYKIFCLCVRQSH